MTELLQIQWTNFPSDTIHYKRFRRIGALLEWLEDNPEMETKTVIIKRAGAP